MKKSGYLFFALSLTAIFCFAACTFDAEEWATVTTFAGKAGEAGNVNGTGADALFDSPDALALDRYENLYVGDSGNHRVRKITPSGEVTDFTSLGGPARGMAYDAKNDWLYVSDHWKNTINRYDMDGTLLRKIGVYEGSGSLDGPATQATFNGPCGLAVDTEGNVYVADMWNSRIRKIDEAGYVSTLAGGVKGRANGTGTSAQFSNPSGVAISKSDAGTFLIVTDTWNHCIRAVSLSGQTTVAAGRPGSWGFKDGEGSAAMVGLPQLMASDRSGNVYFSDKMISAVRVMSPGTVVWAPEESPAYMYPPTDPKWPAYPPNTNNRPQKIVGRTINTVAGLGAWSDAGSRFIGHGYADGTNEQARFDFAHRVDDPKEATGEREVGGAGIAVTARGVIYVADTGNHVIRKIAP